MLISGLDKTRMVITQSSEDDMNEVSTQTICAKVYLLEWKVYCDCQNVIGSGKQAYDSEQKRKDGFVQLNRAAKLLGIDISLVKANHCDLVVN